MNKLLIGLTIVLVLLSVWMTVAATYTGVVIEFLT